MGSRKGPYTAEFPIDTNVQIKSHLELKEFQKSWKKHHPLNRKQLEFGGRTARVKEVSFYHGGDELYVLEGIPGIWHEHCLRPVEE